MGDDGIRAVLGGFAFCLLIVSICFIPFGIVCLIVGSFLGSTTWLVIGYLILFLPLALVIVLIIIFCYRKPRSISYNENDAVVSTTQIQYQQPPLNQQQYQQPPMMNQQQYRQQPIIPQYQQPPVNQQYFQQPQMMNQQQYLQQPPIMNQPTAPLEETPNQQTENN
ncbi:argonaut-like protein [Anaeramoeba ignava]|uniref:Argonaut-like protein n=1 Tax=Anaeramoeba ignava TaxID=1746090 RepID=A0A9Q0R9C1_ANAIG|nr:argonaut-like protein [Anaeramoeba ignava]